MQILFFLGITTASVLAQAAKTGWDKKPKDFFSTFKGSLHKINTAIRLQALTRLSVKTGPGARLAGNCGVRSVNMMTQDGTKV